MAAEVQPWIIIITIGVVLYLALIKKKKGTAILAAVSGVLLFGAVADPAGTVGAFVDALANTLSGS